MTIPPQLHVPLTVAAWLVALPLFIAFFAGAGAGTFLDPVSSIAATFFAIYGGPSIIVGLALVIWATWRAWRSGALRADAAHRVG